MNARWVLVAYVITESANGDDYEAKLLAYGPFESRENAFDYADEFHGAWQGYNIVPLKAPEY